MLGIFHAGPELFPAGWFAESLATQTLVIFAIRTRRSPFTRSPFTRSPFTRSRPSRPLLLLLATLGTVAVGVALPLSPLAPLLGFVAPPAPFFLALAGMVVAYLVLIELAKRQFFAQGDSYTPDRPATRRRGHRQRVQRRAARFSVAAPLPDRSRPR
jgi:Mg2+-importing ATPase